MADTEKITINLGVVDLGRIDLLVEQGFYSTRTDFIRTAIRNQSEKHEQEIQETVVRQEILVGVLIHSKEGLEKKREKGEKLKIVVVGMLVMADDISVELALATIESIKVFGTLKASASLKKALSDRIF